MTKQDVVDKLRELAEFLENVSFNEDVVTSDDFRDLLEMLEEPKRFAYYLSTLQDGTGFSSNLGKSFFLYVLFRRIYHYKTNRKVRQLL